MRKILLLSIIFIAFAIHGVGQNAWINELHYDNDGGDVGEFVEVVIENAGSYALSDFVVYLYNGSNKTTYGNKSVDNFTVGSTVGDFTIYYWYPSSIQNGEPDGLALIYQGATISGQFLSYEGSFEATDGPAAGETSVDIGVSESNSTPQGESLQLLGSGSAYGDFAWQDPANETPGTENNSQSLGSAAAVLTPVISPATGDFFAPIVVSITCGTNGASIYYTTDGSDPDETSTLYSESFTVSTTTTVKARAYKTGMSESTIATNVFTFPTVNNIDDIAQLRTQTVGSGDYYILTGEAILTFQQSYRNNKYIQDATAAILIDDDSNIITTTYNLYDGITGITGTLNEDDGMLQFIPTLDPGTATSTGNTITPEIVSLAQITSSFEDYEAELVKVESVEFTDAGTNFANGTVYEITDGSKATYNFRTTFYDVDYIGTVIPSGSQDLVLIPNSITDGEFVTSRSITDISPSSGGNTATKLDITSINGGNSVYDGQPFCVTVKAQDVDGVATNVDVDVNITLAIETGTGILGGTLTGTIVTGNNTVTISGVTYTPFEAGVVVNASDDASNLTAGNSDTFDVLEVIIPDLVITEIMYHAMGGEDTLEYIELYNNGDAQIDLENFVFTQGVEYTFGSETLDIGNYLLVAKNASAIMDAFGVSALEWTSNGLSNSGEDIEIRDAADNVVAFVDYDTNDPWPSDETGKSIRFCNPSLDNNDPANWSISVEFLATVEGEDMYGTPLEDCGNAPLDADFETDETNINIGESVNFTDLSTGSPTSWEWEFTGGTPATSSLQNPIDIVYDNPGEYDVTLTVYLSDDSDIETKIDYIIVVDPTEPPVADFVADITTVFVGQSVNFTDMSTNSPTIYNWDFEGGTPLSSSDANPTITYNTVGVFDVSLYVENSAGNDTEVKTDYITVLPIIIYDLVITEIMYNPPESGTDSLEFLELYNNGDETINLEGFSFTDGIEYVFPNIDLAPENFLLVSVNSLAMMNTFGVDALQWTSGGLNNGGERIELCDNFDFIVDSLTYDNHFPWDSFPDGNGPSLTLCNPNVDNSIPENWTHSINYAAINADGDSIWATPGFGCQVILLPGFDANVTNIVVGDYVVFTDLTIGDPIDWKWTFEGGTPEIVFGQNPPDIYYYEEGIWDVTLFVSDGENNAEITYQDYIEVVYMPAPTSLEAEVDPYDDVQLTWSAPSAKAQIQRDVVAELLGYNVYRDDVKINDEIVEVTEYNDSEASIGSHDYYVTALYDSGESEPSNTVSVVVTDINEVAANMIAIYPNPTEGIFTVEYTGENILDISIIDITGKEVYNNTMNKSLQINTSSMHTGMYFVRLNDDSSNTFIIKKLIIK